MTYREMMDERNDEIMCDVRKRQANAAALYERFKGDREGLRRYEEANLVKLGFRSEPTGHGTTRLVRIEQSQEDAPV